MKKILIMLVAGSLLASCAKQNINSSGTAATTEDRITTPPSAVLNSFTSNFGAVPVSQWGVRSDGTYRAHFTWKNVAWEATFKTDGTLVKSEAA